MYCPTFQYEYDAPKKLDLCGSDCVARELRVGVADALAGVAAAEVRLRGTALETSLAADGRTAIARVPAGLVLDGATVSVRVLDASSPANAAERTGVLPARPRPLLRGLGASAGRVTGRVIAGAPARVRVWAYAKGLLPRRQMPSRRCRSGRKGRDLHCHGIPSCRARARITRRALPQR